MMIKQPPGLVIIQSVTDQCPGYCHLSGLSWEWCWDFSIHFV